MVVVRLWYWFSGSLLNRWKWHPKVQTWRNTANLRTKILGFRGFDSCIILNWRGGILMSMGFPVNAESTNLSRDNLVGRLGVLHKRITHSRNASRWDNTWKEREPTSLLRVGAEQADDLCLLGIPGCILMIAIIYPHHDAFWEDCQTPLAHLELCLLWNHLPDDALAMLRLTTRAVTTLSSTNSTGN